MATRSDRNMPAQPVGGERGSTSDDRNRDVEEDDKLRGVGESDDDEFEDIEDLEEEDEEEEESSGGI